MAATMPADRLTSPLMMSMPRIEAIGPMPSSAPAMILTAAWAASRASEKYAEEATSAPSCCRSAACGRG